MKSSTHGGSLVERLQAQGDSYMLKIEEQRQRLLRLEEKAVEMTLKEETQKYTHCMETIAMNERSNLFQNNTCTCPSASSYRKYVQARTQVAGTSSYVSVGLKAGMEWRIEFVYIWTRAANE